MPPEPKLPPRKTWSTEFLRFGVVGAVGFAVNVSVVYATRYWFGLYLAGFAAWMVAATVTWQLNRTWTFRSHSGRRPLHREWAWFLAVNFAGFLLYYPTYISLVTYLSSFAAQPILAIFAGMLVSMTANFVLSRRYVFA